MRNGAAEHPELAGLLEFATHLVPTAEVGAAFARHCHSAAYTPPLTQIGVTISCVPDSVSTDSAAQVVEPRGESSSSDSATDGASDGGEVVGGAGPSELGEPEPDGGQEPAAAAALGPEPAAAADNIVAAAVESA